MAALLRSSTGKVHATGPQGGPRCGVRSGGLVAFDGQLADITCQLCLRRIEADGGLGDLDIGGGANDTGGTASTGDLSNTGRPGGTGDSNDASGADTGETDAGEAGASEADTARQAAGAPRAGEVDAAGPATITADDPQAVADLLGVQRGRAADPRPAAAMALAVALIIIWLLRRRRR